MQNNLQNKKNDIVELIIQDHKELKSLLKILKDTDQDETERFLAFEKFSPLLHLHTVPEEKSLYEFLKSKEELEVEGLEGETEHAIADQLLHEIFDLEDKSLWSAKVKVLSELVLHHIHEEEKYVLPHFAKHSNQKMRADLGAKFLELKKTTGHGLPLIKVLAEEIYIEQGKNH